MHKNIVSDEPILMGISNGRITSSLSKFEFTLYNDVQQRPSQDHSRPNRWLPEPSPARIPLLEEWETDTRWQTSLEMREEGRPLPW